jgi:hypothetical protein
MGWLGLIPLLGVPPAAIAVIVSKQTQMEVGEQWNPAEKYLFWGCLLAWAGLASSALLLAGSTALVSLGLLR